MKGEFMPDLRGEQQGLIKGAPIDRQGGNVEANGAVFCGRT